MGQTFKAVYFGDISSETSKSKNLTLAFGKSDGDVFELIRPLSSEQVRTLLGYSTFGELSRAASTYGDAVNKFCIRRLRTTVVNEKQLPLLPESAPEAFHPLQATYKAGKGEALHEWFPYLEGYSYGFIDRVLATYCSSPKRILDPFGGCGTTAISASMRGIPCLYCEVNPVLQFVTEVKVLALSASEKQRKALAESLQVISLELGGSIAKVTADPGLTEAYRLIFGSAVCFNPKTLDQIVRIRTLIDNISCQDLPLAKLLSIAIISSLVPSSYLIRRGDLRFRNEDELVGHRPNLLELVHKNVQLISRDLLGVQSLKTKPILLCEDARALSNLESCSADCVITSPPYLNGTNYFRNTKLELWFLRAIRDRSDLAHFRYKSITGGINDVTQRKLANAKLLDAAKEAVHAVSAANYDQRIPAMVQCYFAEMHNVFVSLKRHLLPGSIVAVDIGDSAYSNVHVPTHEILKKILISEGFDLMHEVTLRRRVSRGGFPLSQKLLVFKTNDSASRRLSVVKAWRPRWRVFKNTLPHQTGAFQKRNWGHPLHSLCSYQGKMKPSIAAHLVRTFVPEGGSLLDPFAGVGTIPFEGALFGAKCWAFDISPTAAFITRAKLAKPDADACFSLVERLNNFICNETPSSGELSSAKALGFNGKLGEYFHPRTLQEVILARRFFVLNPPGGPSASLAIACLLHILHGNRPYALSRRSHPITPFAPSGPYEYRPLIPRLSEKLRRSLSVEYPSTFVDGQFFFQDATTSWPVEVDQLDAVITSPPFFDSTRFHLANWLRLWFCGWEQSDFRTRPRAFVDELQKQSFQVYEPVFRQARERLKRTGVVVLHLGKSRKCDMQERILAVAKNWFSVLDTFTEDVQHCESHGIRDKGTVTAHQYAILG